MPTAPVQLPKSGENLRLMAVHAHPDDESSKGAASMARYVNEGVEVLVVTCTGGERGDILNPKFELGDREISHVRREEMAQAVQILGVSHTWLGFVDSGFPEGDPKPPLPADCFAAKPLEEVTLPLIDAVRQFRPHVITTYDENGGYPHPDHIRTHEVAVRAFELAADENYITDLPAWSVAKLYYHHTFTQTRVKALHQACLDEGLDSPYHSWLDGWDEDDHMFHRITTRVPVSDFFEVRDAALRAHATQIDPDGSWFGVPLNIQCEVWPTDDYELAISRIGDIIVEEDLFEGLRAQ